MRKILFSVFIITGLLIIAATATGAYFSDQETIQGSSFSTGYWSEPVINEILPHPSDSVSEWIEIKNNQPVAMSLNGYTIQDGTTNVKNLNGYSIPANGYLVLHKGIDFSFGLNDPGDIIILKKLVNPVNIIDQVTYGNWNDGNLTDNAPVPGTDQSLARIPNGHDTNNDANDFQIITIPTPGVSND